MREALRQALARRLVEPKRTRDVAKRGEDIADRAPRVHAAEELRRLLEVHARWAARSVARDEEPHRVHPEEGFRVVVGHLAQPAQAGEQRFLCVLEVAAALGQHALGVQHGRGRLAVTELLGQRMTLGIEALGAVVAAGHVLVDADLVEGVSDLVVVAQLAVDGNSLRSKEGQPARPAKTNVHPARGAQRLRTQHGGLGSSLEHGLKQPAALPEVAPGHPHRPHEDGHHPLEP